MTSRQPSHKQPSPLVPVAGFYCVEPIATTDLAKQFTEFKSKVMWRMPPSKIPEMFQNFA
jgi:hypothetical protein